MSRGVANSRTARIPGKIMLAGEYAVLLGGRALATTVSLALDVRIAAAPEVEGVRVVSNIWDTSRVVSASDILDAAAMQTLCSEPLLHAAAHAARRHDLIGVEFKVDSALDTSFGVGSSSALRLGVGLAAAAYACSASTQTANEAAEAAWDEAREAYVLQKQSQSRASGYDIAVQLAGGLVCFTPPKDAADWPGEVRTLGAAAQQRLREIVHPLVGGCGAPTTPVLRETLTWLGESNLYAELFDRSEHLVDAFASACTESTHESLRALVAAVAQHRKLFVGSPHFPAHVAALLQELSGFDERWTFKTTGAGGEDALLLIGTEADVAAARQALAAIGWRKLPAEFTSVGAHVFGTKPLVDNRKAQEAQA